MDADKTNKTNLLQPPIVGGGLLGALIIGYLLGILFPWGPNLKSNQTVGTATTSANQRANASGTEISVYDQPPGDYVIINKLKLAAPGWVVIYDVNEQGEPRRIINASYFDRGDYQNVRMDLIEGTRDAQKYWVILHSDDGLIFQTQWGAHPFDYLKDQPLLDANGQKIGVSFLAHSGGSRGEY